jgi:DNA polymerase III alpha subunit
VAGLGELAAGGAEQALVGGLVAGLKVRPIKEGRNQGKRMASFMVEDQSGSVRAVAFADAYERLEKLLADGAPLLFTAALRSADGEHVELSVEGATPLEGIEARAATALRLHIDVDGFSEAAAVEHLYELILRHEGKIPLRLRLVGTGWRADVTPTRVLGVNPRTLVPELTALLGPGRVEYVFNGA